MTTVYDVARAAGVSTATVSRVVRGSDLVHPETRQQVLEVIEKLGFVPDGSAQGLSRRRKDIVGLVILAGGIDENDIEGTGLPFVDQIVHAAERVLRGSGCSLLLSFASRGEELEQHLRSMTGKVDGLLVAEEVIPVGRLRALARGIPVVVIAGRHDERELDVVAVNNVDSMRSLALHLTRAHGYRRLCFASGPPDAPDARDRRAVFEETVRGTAGCVLEPAVEGDFSEASGSAAARVLLGRAALPEAVACANDHMAIGMVKEFRRAGVSVPGAVAVTGFDDIYPSRVVEPPLTTVRQPLRDLGAHAAARLLARIEDRALPACVEVLDTNVIIRASCGCSSLKER
jgi:LacI family transcriptional regulator